jgi:hypothetical protein
LACKSKRVTLTSCQLSKTTKSRDAAIQPVGFKQSALVLHSLLKFVFLDPTMLAGRPDNLIITLMPWIVDKERQNKTGAAQTSCCIEHSTGARSITKKPCAATSDSKRVRMCSCEADQLRLALQVTLSHHDCLLKG